MQNAVLAMQIKADELAHAALTPTYKQPFSEVLRLMRSATTELEAERDRLLSAEEELATAHAELKLGMGRCQLFLSTKEPVSFRFQLGRGGPHEPENL